MSLSILLNARTVTNGDGYVRRITLEFAKGKQHKRVQVELLPGMTRTEVASELRKSADNVESGCETELAQ